MSYNKQSLPLPVRLRKAEKYGLSFDLEAEGLELIDGKLIRKNPNQVDLLDRPEIEQMSEEEFEQYLKPLTKGARFLAFLVRDARWLEEKDKPTDQKLLGKVAAYKEARAWIANQTPENQDFLSSQEIYPKTLVCDFYLRFSGEFDKFIELYKESCDRSRNWRSSRQPNLGAVRILATTREYQKLPLWVKVNLLQANVWIPKDRIGNIWRLIPCSRAWKWERELPKRIAERVGEMPVGKRIAAKFAWRMIDDSLLNQWHYRHNEPEFSRSELENQFWLNFNSLANNAFLLLEKISEETSRDLKKQHQARQAEAVLGLPHKFFSDGFDPNRLLEYQQYIDKDQLLLSIFGTNAKSVKRAWDNAGVDQIRWAIALAEKGNPDVVRQFLLSECVLPFEEESVAFLQSLGWKKALRMIQTLTYRVRGEEHLVEQFLVKDTGMLYNNIVRQGDTPNLGRVRCWLSVHEELGRQYIKVLPDEPVAIPEGWKPLNGLCDVKGEWSIHLPTSTGELKLWGEQLHNCVGGYGKNINKGQSIVFAVRVHGQIRYCVEICNHHCNQFLGDRNSKADSKVQNAVLGALRQARLVY